MSFLVSFKNLLRSFFKKNKPSGFLSKTDAFLQNFDQNHPKKSRSQRKEIEKFKPIFYRRDHVVGNENKSKVWEGF